MASTKAILAALPKEEREAHVADMTFARCTENTITEADAFRKELDETQARGYGIDRAEALHGVHCAAARGVTGRNTRPLLSGAHTSRIIRFSM